MLKLEVTGQLAFVAVPGRLYLPTELSSPL